MRHCYFPVPRWLGSGGVGQSWEWLTEVKPFESWRYDAVGKPLWSHATGWTRLEPIADERTRATFTEEYEAFNPIMRVLFEKRVHEGLSRDNDTILAALNGGLAWHRRRKRRRRRPRQPRGEPTSGRATSPPGPATPPEPPISPGWLSTVSPRSKRGSSQSSSRWEGVSSPGSAATAASGATTGADFASLLTDAMGTQAAGGLGGSASGSAVPSGSD